jgi:hypothetical protein
VTDSKIDVTTTLPVLPISKEAKNDKQLTTEIMSFDQNHINQDLKWNDLISKPNIQMEEEDSAQN